MCLVSQARVSSLLVVRDEDDPHLGNSSLRVLSDLHGVDPVAIASLDTDPETGMAEVVVELVRDGIYVIILVELVAELNPILPDVLRLLVPILVQDVAGIPNPAESGIHANHANLLPLTHVGSLSLQCFYGPDEWEGKFLPKLLGSEIYDLITESRYPMGIPRILGVGGMLRYVKTDALDLSIEAVCRRKPNKLVRYVLTESRTPIFSDVSPMWASS